MPASLPWSSLVKRLATLRSDCNCVDRSGIKLCETEAEVLLGCLSSLLLCHCPVQLSRG